MTEQLKLIKVRPGMSGFYTKVLESGEYGRIPVSIKETKNGWFDDVPEQEDHLSAAMAGRLSGANANAAKTYLDGGTNPSNGAGSPSLPNQVGGEKTHYAQSETALVGDAPSAHTADESSNEAPADESQKVDESQDQSKDSADSKEPTKSDIIKELEELGVKEFNRSNRKDELQALLDSVKAGLVQE